MELTGRLLLSNATLFDPNFRRTVVLIGHHDDEGAVGVVLNRPLGVPVDAAVPPLSDLVAVGEELFEGGPVEPDAAVVIAEFSDLARAGILAFGAIGFLPDEMGAEDRDAIVRARIFAGYSGWGPSQLEGEIEAGGWFVVDAHPDDLLTADPAGLWRAVLRRQGGDLAVSANYPLGGEGPAAN